MKFASLHVRGRDTGVRVGITETAPERIRGLLKHDVLASNEALLLQRCACVHTFGMRFAIDVLFLNRARQIVAVHHAVPRRRMLISFRSTQTLEMAANTAREHGLIVGETLSFEAMV